jgi:methane monooxygenase PmoA-like
LYPVLGPGGAQVTRNWPVKDGVKGKHKDHPHHKSIWVAHGECDKVDNWSEEEGHGWQRHVRFSTRASGSVYGQIIAKNDWCAHSGRKQFEEVRDMRFYALPGGTRLLDVAVTFKMSQRAVTFRDTKEGGLLSVRVASSMDVRNGGRIDNGYGGIDEDETWGKKAPWCDYSGKVDGQHVGIAVFDHDTNPRYPTEWHVRDYGLMTANCFGWSYFRPEAKTKGDMAFRKGSSTTWRYRLYIHKGDAKHGKVGDRYFDFIAPPRVTVG